MIPPIIRRLASMVFSRATAWWSWPKRADYKVEVGDPLESSTVAAPVMWFARTFPEAPPALWQLDNGQEEQEHNHPLLQLLQRPNEFFTGPLLWMATTVDWLVNGNAYWIVIRSASGVPVEAWYAPSWMVTPRGSNDGTSFIQYYEYRVDAEPKRLDPDLVVHFRYGADPRNPRVGRSALGAVLSEIFTDNEAAAFTASILRNMGVPGILVSPDTDQPISDEDAKAAKKYVTEKFTGEHRGEALVMRGRTKVQQFGFSPEQLLLKEIRRIPEERVTAVLGIPAIVAGLGAGLDRSTFTNMAEARAAAYESGLIPCQRILGEEIRFQLLPLYNEDPFKWRFGFDLSKVRVLQEDLYRLAQRHALGVREGTEMVSEYRRAMGLDVDEARDDIFLRQANVVQVSDGTPTPLAPSKNGTGARDVADEVIRALERRELTEGARA